MMPEKYLKFLNLLQDLSPDEIGLLSHMFTVCEEGPETVIFEQGDSAEYLYIIAVGEVVIRFKPDDGPPLDIAHVPSGSVIGWSAALGNPYYTSSAVCATRSTLLRVLGVDLRALCEEHHQLGEWLLERLASGVSEKPRPSHDQIVSMLEHRLRSNVKID